MQEINKRSWAFKTINKKDLRYHGNNGYEDNPIESYSYDNFVANHKQVKEGDIAIIYDRAKIIGIAEITKLTQVDSMKKINQCPIENCKPEKLRKRDRFIPKWKCSNHHEFDEPMAKIIPVVKYTAFYAGHFKKVTAKVVELENKIINHNKQLSIQEVKFEWAKKLLEGGEYTDCLGEDEADEPAALFNKEDLREIVNRSIKQRRGQHTFRKNLLSKSNCCAITKCIILDLLETAHIFPYRNSSHNHPSNGILLRADIHTLFDLNMIAINPSTHKVHISAKLVGSEYSAFEGRILSVNHPLSEDALEERWKIFLDE